MNEADHTRQITQGLSSLRRILAQAKWLKRLVFATVGIVIAIALHAGIAGAMPDTGNTIKANTPEQAIAPAPSQQSAEAVPLDLLMQQAEDYYQAGQTAEAIALWQQAVARYQQQGDRPNQALVLSFLAQAFDDLGQWSPANQAIAQAIALIDTHPSASNPDAAWVLAQVLTIQGALQLDQGLGAEALSTWQAAEVAYQATDDSNGILGSQINQARALQSAGFYRQARDLLTQVEQALQDQPDSPLKVTGLRNLGKVLRWVGDLAQSRQVLEQSLAIARRLSDAPVQSASETISAADISGILLSLGNTTRAQGNLDQALAFYQQAAAIAPSVAAATQVQLVQLSLLVEAQRWAEAERLVPEIQSRLSRLPSGNLAVYGQINLAQSVVKLISRATATAAMPSPALFSASAQALATAIQDIHHLGNIRAESYALGTLGSLYETTRQWDEAQRLTQQALDLAQSMAAADIAYQWQWQLGRISCQGMQPCAGNLPQAMAAYADAVKSLQSLRSDLVAISQDVQFSFRESVEPVYRQYVELLLQADTDGSGSDRAPSQANLKQAREVIEALQLAELDNFFREACVNARPVDIDQIDPQAAVIYPIILPNQLAVILALPSQPLIYHKTSLAQAEVERILTQMRQSLRPTAFIEDWLPAAQQVYDLLLRPVETELAASGINTLVFVPDGVLRSLPMAALHDGQRYLIETYSVVLTPGLQLLQPRAIERQRLRPLLAGVSQAREGFASLPNVAVEINQIQAELPGEVLLNQAFTNQSFQTHIETTPASIVHLATHAQFSSNAEDTFILTWDGHIDVKQLTQLLRSREGDRSPIELLVLSACQTATGDRRAALGIAGVAVRSGARSTLASLWSVSDRSTAALMIEFYRQLGLPEVTKAEALRQAQIALLHQNDYASPYYWAPFVLLGNWL
ncbi:MAG TPA: CHAT domain-containing protein [Chroococcidiopsis sp.]